MLAPKDHITLSLGAVVRSAASWPIIVFLFPALTLASAGADQPRKNMSIGIGFNVHWQIRSGDNLNRGAFDLRCNGIADLNATWSMMDKAAPPGSFVTYSTDGVTCRHAYEEKIFQDHPPEGCGSLLAEYHGTGSFNLQQLNTGMTSGLNIRRLGSLIPRELLYMAPPEARDVLVDYYDFFAFSPGMQVHGRSRESNDCFFRDVTRDIQPTITIRSRIAEDGSMAGSRRWKARGNVGAPSLQVRVANLPQRMERRSMVPEPDPEGDVSYALSWTFGKVQPVLRIEHREGQSWIPLSADEPLEVTAGEKIELRGIVLPEAKDPKRGRWKMTEDTSSDGKLFIKKFKATRSRGEVKYLDGRDLGRPAIIFYGVRNGTARVEYTTVAGGKQLNEHIEIKVKRPEFQVKVTVEDSCGVIRPLALGVPVDSTGYDCCYTYSGKDLEELTKCDDKRKAYETLEKECQRIAMKCASIPDDNSEKPQCNAQLESCIGDRDAARLEAEGACGKGPQCKIEFVATQTAGRPGDVQYVQLVSTDSRSTRMDNGHTHTARSPEGIDGCYPTYQGPHETDQPGFGIQYAIQANDKVMPVYSHEQHCYHFKTYMMYRPQGEDNEWVPIKMHPWEWCGAVECDSYGNCGNNSTSRPESGQAADTARYPEWRRCSGQED